MNHIRVEKNWKQTKIVFYIQQLQMKFTSMIMLILVLQLCVDCNSISLYILCCLYYMYIWVFCVHIKHYPFFLSILCCSWLILCDDDDVDDETYTQRAHNKTSNIIKSGCTELLFKFQIEWMAGDKDFISRA